MKPTWYLGPKNMNTQPNGVKDLETYETFN